MYIGIDGCRTGWVVATIGKKQQLSVVVIDKLTAISNTKAAKIYIDIPLHFAQQQYRTCELAARRLLGAQKMASVFLTPCKEAVFAESFVEANRINKTLMGKGVSIQAWNIFGKIKEAVAFAATSALPLQEAHPELCFWFLNKQQPLLSKKSTPQGIADRMKMIASVSQNYEAVVEATLSKTKRKDVKQDDILDAVVLAIRAASTNVQAVLATDETQDCGNIFFL